MCRNYPSGPHMEGVLPPSFSTECNSAGNMLSCQLCPLSPNYHRRTAAPPVADPWNGTQTTEAAPEPAPRTLAISFDMKSEGWYMGPEGPCVLCLKPTKLYSPAKRVPCHAECANQWKAGRRIFAQPR